MRPVGADAATGAASVPPTRRSSELVGALELRGVSASARRCRSTTDCARAHRPAAAGIRRRSARWRSWRAGTSRRRRRLAACRRRPCAARAICQPPATEPHSFRYGTEPACAARGLRRRTSAPSSRSPICSDAVAAASRRPIALQRRHRTATRRRAATLSICGGDQPRRRAAVARRLAADQVVGLDAGRAFVDRDDARVAVVLRGAGLLDEAHAAVHLHAERTRPPAPSRCDQPLTIGIIRSTNAWCCARVAASGAWRALSIAARGDVADARASPRCTRASSSACGGCPDGR